jgi:hypothetical protein
MNRGGGHAVSGDQLARGLLAVAERLEPNVAAQLKARAASALTQAMSRASRPYVNIEPAQGLAVMAAYLEPKIAAQQCAQAAEIITQAMTKTNLSDSNAPYNLIPLLRELTAMAEHLEPKEAAQQIARALSVLTQAVTKTNTSNYFSVTNQLAPGLVAMAARLEPKDAAHTGSVLIQAMSNAQQGSSQLGKWLSATLTQDPRNPHIRVAGLVAGVGLSNYQPLPASTALILTLELLPCRLSTQELVDLLKHPFCVDEARRVVLEQLERRYHRKFADHWEFVRFATAQRLGLDFTTPPRRPDLPAPETRS